MNNNINEYKKLSLCKKLQYTILYNKKFDWLKREKDWKLDRIDGYMGMFMISLFLLIRLLGEVFVLPAMLLFYSGGIVGYIRQIKSTPGNVESRLMSNMICVGFIFFSISLIITVFVALSRVF